jgi:hypothetical protein
VVNDVHGTEIRMLQIAVRIVRKATATPELATVIQGTAVL